MTLYNTNCSGCHGTGKASDSKVATVSGITTIMKESQHVSAGLNTRFTAQNMLDLAAYISSPK
jgi:mono/diheme cytochrome c family protein